MNGWHLDKRVPISLIAAIILQTLGFAFWGGTVSSRVDALERSAESASLRGERIAAVETEIRALRRVLERIESKLDRRAPN